MNDEKRMYLSHKISKANVPYFRLYIDLGYKEATVTFDRYWISEFLKVPVWDLETKYPVSDTPSLVGSVSIK